MAVGTSLIPLAELRDTVAAVLTSTDAEAFDVLVDVADAIYPPIIEILPAQPYVTPDVEGLPRTMGPCMMTAHVRARCIASRIDPAPAFRVLDQMVEYVITRMRAGSVWPMATATGALSVDKAGISYLAADVTYDIPIAV